jgi:hypothetical protein
VQFQRKLSPFTSCIVLDRFLRGGEIRLVELALIGQCLHQFVPRDLTIYGFTDESGLDIGVRERKWR